MDGILIIVIAILDLFAIFAVFFSDFSLIKPPFNLKKRHQNEK
jgi:hypothetical protein